MTGLEEIHALVQSLSFAPYSEADRDAVRSFRCASYGDKPAKAAQKMIRAAPDRRGDFGPAPMFLLARDGNELVGIVIFGLESEGAPAVTVFVLGVKLSRQREGIGTILKLLAMAGAATRDDWPNAVASQVHRRNKKMIGLNDKLGVAKEVDPTDGEFLLTAVVVELGTQGTTPTNSADS